jgi:hypothetical protein
VDACQCGGCGACHADVTSSDGFMPMSRSGHGTTLRRGFPCNHSDITSTVGRPMAPRRRGWWARRLSGRGIGRVLSSPPSDGRHGVTEWPPTSALSVRIASANTWADMVGTGPEPALQRWSVRRVKAHTSAAGFRCTRILAGTDDPGTEGHGNCRRSGTLRDSDVLIARVPGKRAAVAFHVPTNPPKGRKSDAGEPAYAIRPRGPAPWVVNVSWTAQPRVATSTSTVSDFRPTTGLVYVGSPLAAGTSPWHSTTPIPSPRMPAGRLRLLVRRPAAFARPVSALSRPASAGKAGEATRTRPPGGTGRLAALRRRPSCAHRFWWG